jgi:bacterioferritin
MKIEDFIEDLNIILKLEYGAVMQYILHAHRLSVQGEKKQANEILKMGNDEIRHSENLSTKIKALGGKPVDTARWDEGADDLELMLRINLESEKKSIKVYRNMIKVAEKEEFKGLETLLEEQLEDEIRHTQILQRYLNK